MIASTEHQDFNKVNNEEGSFMPTAGESPALTEAQMTAGDAVGSHNSNHPDRCASENFNNGWQSGSSALPGENTAPSFVVSTVIERLEPRSAKLGAAGSCLVGIVNESPEVTRIKERNRRLEIVKAFNEMVRPIEKGGLGMTMTSAAKQIGEDYTSIWRYRKAYDEFGEDGLMPDTENSGRKSMFEHVLSDLKFCEKLMELYLATIGASGQNVVNGRRTAKMATALVAMAEEPECPELLAKHLRQGKFPLCLQRYLRRITPEMENRVRGQKHFQLNGLVSRRDLTMRFPDGSRAEMPAGFKWVFDDMSANQPFWLQMDGEFLFTRQGLYGLDHRALRWLGKMLVARPREAYRADDIIRFLRRLFEAYKGKPDVIVFERGVWHARKIRGFKLTETGAVCEDEFIRPEMAEAERANLATGLAALGVKVIFAMSAHGKIIETCFNHLQDVLAIKARRFVNIGRHAGEFELAAKRLRQVRAGSHDPGSRGFAPMTEFSDCIDEAFVHINTKVNSRKEVPDEIFFRGLETRPLMAFGPDDAAALLPEMKEKTIRGGCVTLDINGRPFDFRADWMSNLGAGYRVFAKYDSLNPPLGMAIYNREDTSSPNNHRINAEVMDGGQGKPYALGEFIGFAAWEIPAPCVDVAGPVRGVVSRPLEEFYPGAIDQGDTIRRKQQKQVATIFSALPRPGQPAVKTVEASDGLGNVVRVEKGERTEMAGAPAPAQRRGLLRASAVTPEQRQRNREDLSRQAQLANQLRALAGE